MNHNTEKHFGLGWSLIPPAILSTDKLKANEKLLWGRINGLIGRQGYCYASSKWLSKQLGLTPGTITNLIHNMMKKGFLRRLLVYKKGEEEIVIEKKFKTVKELKFVERRLYPLQPIEEKTPSSNNETPSSNNEDKVVLDSSIRNESKPMQQAAKTSKKSLKNFTYQQVIDLHNESLSKTPPGISRPQILAAVLNGTEGFDDIVSVDGWKTIMMRLGQLYNSNRKVTLPHALLMQCAISMEHIPRPKDNQANINYLISVLTRETQTAISDMRETESQEHKRVSDSWLDDKLDETISDTSLDSVFRDGRRGNDG